MKKVYLKRTRHKCTVANCGNKNTIYIGKTMEISRGTYICEDCLARLCDFAKSGQNKTSYEMLGKKTFSTDDGITESVFVSVAPTVIETIAESPKVVETVFINDDTKKDKIMKECTAITNVFSLRKYARENLGLIPDNSSSREELLKQIEEKLSE